MTIGDILSMSVGEIIPIEIQDPVTMFVDGLPMIRGKYGIKNGRYAVKLESIQHPEEFLKSPLDNARLGPSLMRSQERGELYEQFDERMAALAKEVDSIAPSKNKGE
jgi:flagellar motor switch protein FliM